MRAVAVPDSTRRHPGGVRLELDDHKMPPFILGGLAHSLRGHHDFVGTGTKAPVADLFDLL
jgi:hypothetical protein